MDKKLTAIRGAILFLCTFPNNVFSTSSSAFGTDSCDNANESWKQQGQHYYWKTSSKFSYDNARAECENVPGGQLAEIMDKATLLFFHEELYEIGEGNQ